jgi:hypothetical protein
VTCELVYTGVFGLKLPTSKLTQVSACRKMIALGGKNYKSGRRVISQGVPYLNQFFYHLSVKEIQFRAVQSDGDSLVRLITSQGLVTAHKYLPILLGNRSQVQGSTFRVRNKNKIENPKPLQKMLVLPHKCQYAANFQIGNDEAGCFSHKYASKMESEDKNGTLNP